MSEVVPHNKHWWLVPASFVALLVTALVIACASSEIAREVVAKAFFNIAGAFSTPFILEITVALVGLFAVVIYNHWRLQKEGDGWVYLAKSEPDPTSIADGAETPPHRLDAVVLTERPEATADLSARIATVEGYLELGLKKEALDELRQFTDAEQASPAVQAVFRRIDESGQA